MNRILCLLFFFFSVNIIFAQDCNIPFPPGETCASAPVLCDLDGYCFSNVSFADNGTPNAFCGQVENDGWVSYRAFTPTLEIEVTASNCDLNNGVQAAMFYTEDCQFFELVSNCIDPIPANTTQTIFAENLIPGEIYHFMVDGKGGDRCDISFNVVDGLTSPVADVLPQAYLCENSALALGSEATDLDEYSYTWLTTTGNFIAPQDAPTTFIDQPGDYTLVIIDKEHGCIDSAFIEVLNAELPAINFSEPDTLNCQNGETVVIDALGSDEGNTTVWTGPGIVAVPNSNIAPYPAEVNAPGFYTLTMIVDSTGCTTIDSLLVEIDVDSPFAEAGFPQEIDCATPDVTLNATTSTSGSNFTYEWSSSGGNFLSDENTLTPTVDQPGVYSLLITNAQNGCTSIDNVIVTENPAVPAGADIDKNSPCYGEETGEIIVNDIVSGNPPFLYKLDETPFSGMEQFSSLTPGDYNLTVQDVLGCEWDTTLTIEFIEEIVVDLGPDLELELGDSIDIEALVNSDIESYVWSDNVDSLQCDNCDEFRITPKYSVIYEVQVTDANGCTDSDEILVRLSKIRYIYIPTAFSPNGDGINDLFVIQGGKDVQQINSFDVYTRWGGLVHSARNFQPDDPNFGWDGKLKNRMMRPQVMAWRAEVEYIDGEIDVLTGDVTLMR